MPNNSSITDVLFELDVTANVVSPSEQATAAQTELNRYLDQIREMYRNRPRKIKLVVKEKKKSNLPEWF